MGVLKTTWHLSEARLVPQAERDEFAAWKARDADDDARRAAVAREQTEALQVRGAGRCSHAS